MRAIALIAVATALAALGVTLWLHSDAARVRSTADVDDPEDSPSPKSDGESTAGPSPEPHAADDPHKGHDRPPVDDRDIWADLADPAHSDLPAEVLQEAVDTASKVLVADTTGEGRHRWPHYWRDDVSHRPCCRRVTIHAASAHRDPHHPERLEVFVVWSGESADSHHRSRSNRLTTIHLSARDGRLLPIRDH